MTYIIQSTNFTQEFIDEEIEKCLQTLHNRDSNQMLIDYWMSEMYDEDEQKNNVKWTENTLMELYDDLGY